MLKMYGPYKRPDGRSHVIWHDSVTGKRRTQSYPRYLMEQYLERELLPEEHVDHINNDPTDDRIENLQILTQLENSRKSTVPAEIGTYVCPMCLSTFQKAASQVRYHNEKMNKAGPFCSKKCAGIYGTDIQNKT